MYLTPAEKQIGKENFDAALASRLLRRDFLQKASAQGLRSGAGLGAYYFGYGKTVDRPVRVGVIGTGDEGSVLIGAINPAFVEVTAIADVRPYNIHRAFHGDWYREAHGVRPGLMARYGWKSEDEARRHVKVYGDYRDLLAEQQDIEAVIIALPLHLHAEAAIAAMKAEKHVLTEKLMAHSVHECKEMARVAQQTKLLLATGHQRHYNILYENTVEAIRQGVLGELHYIRAQWHRGDLPGKDSWRQPMPKKAKPDDDLADALDNGLAVWQEEFASEKTSKEKKALLKKRIAQLRTQIQDEIVQAEKYGYQSREIKDGEGRVVYRVPAIEELIRWRLWDRTGGGLMAELGSHQLDAASIFVAAVHGGKKQRPLNVSAAAGRPLFPPDRDVDDHVFCVFEYPAPDYDPGDALGKMKKITVAYASINGNGFGGYGEAVFGTQGTLLLESEKEAMLYKGADQGSKIRLTKGKKDRSPQLVVDEAGDPVSAAVGAEAFAGEISRGYTEELEHWAWCIRNPAPENQPRCGPKVALGDAVIALTTNLAAAKSTRIDFRKEWFDPQSDETPEGVKPDLSRYV